MDVSRKEKANLAELVQEPPERHNQHRDKHPSHPDVRRRRVGRAEELRGVQLDPRRVLRVRHGAVRREQTLAELDVRHIPAGGAGAVGSTGLVPARAVLGWC